ncbi:hypothetical protein D3C87_1229900 [compost metagenome]
MDFRVLVLRAEVKGDDIGDELRIERVGCIERVRAFYVFLDEAMFLGDGMAAGNRVRRCSLAEDQLGNLAIVPVSSLFEHVGRAALRTDLVELDQHLAGNDCRAVAGNS